MTRRFLATACTLLAIAWASLGVAWLPLEAPARPVTTGAAAVPYVAPVRTAAVVGVSTLCGMAAIGFRRPRRWDAAANRTNRGD